MASKRKVQQFLKIANFSEQTREIVQQICNEIKEGRDDFDTLALDIYTDFYNFIFARLNNFVLSLYKDLYTDEELDELITIYSSPIFKKMKERTPEIINRTLTFLKENEEEIEKEAERLQLKAKKTLSRAQKKEHAHFSCN